jgi:hypothetical protein
MATVFNDADVEVYVPDGMKFHGIPLMGNLKLFHAL